jgi:hypothetical protein
MLPAFAACLVACMILTCKVRADRQGVFVALRINGFLMSFLDALRSLAEQVAMSVRLIIASVSTPLMFERVCGEA